MLSRAVTLAAPRALASRILRPACSPPTGCAVPFSRVHASGMKTKGPEVSADDPTTKFTPALTKIDTSAYDAQLQAKLDRIKAQFADLNIPDIEVFESEREHYRMRAEFRVWHEGNDMFLVMYDGKDEETGRQRQVRVTRFPVASRLANELMAALLREVPKDPLLRHKLFQACFHTTLSGQAMVSLVYHKKLNDPWKEAATKLQAVLAAVPGATAPPSVIGRSKGQKVVVGKDEVAEVLRVDGRDLRYLQLEGAFSQPNAGVCAHMLHWARSAAVAVNAGGVPSSDGAAAPAAPARDLLELYCGNGNFAVALAPLFRRVVATEVSKTAVAAAGRNFELNGVTNAKVARVSAEEFTEAWKQGRQMHRLRDMDLASTDLGTVLVDPPRAGLDAATTALLREFDNVIYISCNPDTLHANLEQVRDAFTVERFAIFDQFPYTHHVECGVCLRRTAGGSGEAERGVKRKANGAEEAPAAG